MKGKRMNSRRSLSNEAGFTLIELMMAIAIFSIGLMALGALQTRSQMGTRDLTRKTEAWTIAEEQKETLVSTRFMDTATWTVPAALTAGTQQFTHANGRYDVHWNVEDDRPIPAQNAAVLSQVPAGTYTVCKLITVWVTPVGGNERLAEIQFVKTWWATGMP